MAKPKKKTAKKLKKAPTAKKRWKPTAVTTKAELVAQLKESVDAKLSNKVANDLFGNLFAILATSIKKKGRFSVRGFGTFKVRRRKAREGRNPRTGEKVKIKASKTVSFKPSPKYKGTL